MLDISKVMPSLVKFAKPVTDVIAKNSPKILLATGIAGFVTTVAMAIHASEEGWEVHRSHEWAREKDVDGKNQYEYWLEEAKALVPVYLPTFLMGSASIACIVASSRIQAKRGAAALAAYSLAEKTLETYQEKVVERLGSDAEKEVRQETADKLAEEDLETPPFVAERVYVPTKDDGKEWFRDGFTGRYFRSTRERIREAEATINKRLSSEVTVNLRELWYEWGLEDDMLSGEAFGWTVGQCPLDIFFTTVHKGTPMEYTHIGYHYVLLDPRLFERGR